MKETPIRGRCTLRTALTVLLLILCTPTAFATLQQQSSDEPRAQPSDESRAVPVATVEGITEYAFPNGLRLLLFPDPTRPTTTVNVTYFVGSRHEGYGETGMAHLLEHLQFKGTPDHPNIYDEISLRGGRANGTTWFDRTNYFQTFPASEETLEWSLGMEADRMINSFISAEDLESEMTVVRNEWESGENNPASVLSKRTLGAAFQWHGYGRSTIGERSDIENVPIERLQAFYRRYYQPDNAVVVVSGQFDEEHVLHVVEGTFGVIPRPERTGDMRLFETYTREPTQDGEREVILRRTGDVQMVTAVYHVPAAAHPDFASVDLLQHILGDSPRGRLYRALVETGKASSVSTSALPFREPFLLIARAQVRMDQSVEEVRDLLVSTIEDLTTRPPTEEEIERARTAKLRDLRLMLNNSERVGVGLSEWEASGDWRLVFIHRDRLRDTEAADVVRVASTYLLPSNRTVGMFIPERDALRARIPEAPDVRALVADYQGDEVDVAGEAFDATVANIEARLIREALPGGASLALLPKRTRGGAVIASVSLRLGSEEALMSRRTDGQMAASMLMRGTERLSREELNDELDRLQADVSVSGGVAQVNVRIETVGEHLLEVLSLVGEILQSPAFDAREFEELRRERLAAIENQKSEPNAQASRAFYRHLGPWPEEHPHYIPTFEEEIGAIEAVDLEQVKRFHEEFYGAGSGSTISIVGDFDAGDVQETLSSVLGEWTPPRTFERVPSPYQDVEPLALTLETPDKTNAIILAGVNVAMRDDHPDYPAMVLGDYILGGGFLNSRLETRIRQQDGLSYGVGTAFSAHPIDESGSFLFYAIFAPENVDRVEAAFLEELERAIGDGFTAEEVEAAKQGWLQSREVSRGTDGQLVSMLETRLYLGRTLEHDADLEARVAALTPVDVVEALRRHVEPAAFSIVRAGDFADLGAGSQ